MHDANWLLANHNIINFEENHVRVLRSNAQDPIYNGIFISTMSSEDGGFLFATGGTFVINSEFQVMMNGDTINPGAAINDYYDGLPWVQGSTVLTHPGDPNQFIILNLDMQAALLGTSFFPVVPLNLLYHVVDITQDDGRGAVILKNQIAISDTLTRGYVQAVRHANGRDWWVAVPVWNSNCYYTFSIDSHGAHPVDSVCLGLHLGMMIL